MTNPIRIPWKTKAEWIAVYNSAYSQNYDKVFKAVVTLSEWRRYMDWEFRPGMDCTTGILQITLKDKHFYQDSKNPAELHELQLMYSSEIMRFLNLVSDGAAKGKKKVSLYGRAKEIEIPDWVVNIRHQMAHRNILPAIDTLRIAAKFILKWLKVHYWENEKTAMKEVAVENIVNVIKESLPNLLTVYVFLKEQKVLGFMNIRDIQDPDVKDLIYAVNRFSMQEVMTRCQPWKLKKDEEEICVNLQKIAEYSITKMTFVVLRLLKQFLYKHKIHGVNTLNIFVEKLIEDSVRHNGMRTAVWNTLLKAMHSWYKFPELIKALADKSYENAGEGSHQAAILNVELCKALQKRFKVKYLQDTMLKEQISGKVSRSKKMAKLINLDLNERKAFVNLLLKKNLNMVGKSDNKMLACIFHRVEQKDPNLRHVLRLLDSNLPRHWEMVNLMEYIALKPTDFSKECLCALVNAMEWPITSKSLRHLIKMGQIYMGEGVHIHKVKRVFKASNLEKLVKAMEEKQLGKKRKEKEDKKQRDDIYEFVNSKINSIKKANNIHCDGSELLDLISIENCNHFEISECVTHEVIPISNYLF